MAQKSNERDGLTAGWRHGVHMTAGMAIPYTGPRSDACIGVHTTVL
jgi:hypothetical protein